MEKEIFTRKEDGEEINKEKIRCLPTKSAQMNRVSRDVHIQITDADPKLQNTPQSLNEDENRNSSNVSTVKVEKATSDHSQQSAQACDQSHVIPQSQDQVEDEKKQNSNETAENQADENEGKTTDEQTSDDAQTNPDQTELLNREDGIPDNTDHAENADSEKSNLSSDDRGDDNDETDDNNTETNFETMDDPSKDTDGNLEKRAVDSGEKEENADAQRAAISYMLESKGTEITKEATAYETDEQNLPSTEQETIILRTADQKGMNDIYLTATQEQVQNQNDINANTEVSINQEEGSKYFLVVDNEGTCTVFESGGTEIKHQVADISVAASGDAGTTQDVQVEMNNQQVSETDVADPSFENLNQVIKDEQPESTEKQTSANENYDMDPSLIPIKPIPALNAVPVSKKQSSTDADEAKSIPYVPIDASLLYQPEEGVMKSKPVPKPTRGRRSRRRNYSELTTRMRYGSIPSAMSQRQEQQTMHGPRHVCQQRPYLSLRRTLDYPAEYYNMVPGRPEEEYEAMHPGAAGDMVGYSNAMGNLPSNVPPQYHGNMGWCATNEHFKVPHHWYAPRGRGGRGGRPRGRRGSGGVRQYLQHRLLWARYTGRSQEALDRVLTIINNKCSLKDDIQKEESPKFWNEAAMMSEKEYKDLRFDANGAPCTESADPYNAYSTQPPFASGITNMLAANPNNSSIPTSIGSNAVVDGNGYIVYLNQEDNTDYRNQPNPYIPAETCKNRGDMCTTGIQTVKGSYSGEESVNANAALPQHISDNMNTACIMPNKMDMGNALLAPKTDDMDEITRTAETFRVPKEGCTPTDEKECTEQDDSVHVGIQKKTTGKPLKTPVSPIKGQKGQKRQGQESGGKQRKKVRRSLTFSSPIKQDETLKATENIANAMSNSSKNESDASTESLPPTTSAATLPSVSSLLQSAANTGISINIHVTSDVNERASRNSADDMGMASRMHSSVDQLTDEAAVRDGGKRAIGAEASVPVQYPGPRYTVEWHGDYPPPGTINRAHRFHQQPQPGLQANSNSCFRYPYRDHSGKLGYFRQEQPYPPFHEHPFTPDWQGPHMNYLSEHYMPNYEQHPSVPAMYPPANLMQGGWERGMDVYPDMYEEPTDSRAAHYMAENSGAYAYYQRSVPYPNQPSFSEGAYRQLRSCYAPGAVAAYTPETARQKVVPVPNSLGSSRQQSMRPPYGQWMMSSGIQDPQGMDRGIPEMHHQPELPVQSAAQEPSDASGVHETIQLESVNKLPSEHVQM